MNQRFYCSPNKRSLGYIGIALSVTPSVRPSVRLSMQNSFSVCRFLIDKHRNAYDLRGVMTLNQRQLGKIKVPGRKSAKFVSILYLFYGETLEVLTSHKYCFSRGGSHYLYQRLF